MKYLSILETIPFFQKFSRTERYKILQDSFCTVLQAGEFLFQKGDHFRSLYLLLEGELKEIHLEQGGDRCFWIDIKERMLFGQWELLTESTWSFSLIATTTSHLLQIDIQWFEEWKQRHKEGNALFWQDALISLERHQLIKFLPKYFGVSSSKEIAEISHFFNWISMKKEEKITLAEGIYILLLGHLRGGKTNSADECDLKDGDAIHFCPLFGNSSSTCEYRAIRESHLVHLNEEAVEKLLEDHPLMIKHLFRAFSPSIVGTTNVSDKMQEHCTNILLLPLHPTLDGPRIARMFLNSFLHNGKTILIDQSTVMEALKIDFKNNRSLDKSHRVKLIAWLDELECEYDRILFLGDHRFGSWTHQLLEIADMVVSIVDRAFPPALTNQELLLQREKMLRDKHHYLLLATKKKGHISSFSTRPWLETRVIERHFHLDLSSVEEFDRIARSLSGSAHALVLSSGGKKGVAHLGVIQAMEELHIPIDYIAGTGSGAIAAMAYALDRFQTMGKETFLRLANALRPTLPLLSLYNGPVFHACLKEMFGELHIEELLLPTFCLSYNSSEERLFLHDRGLVCDALYATSATPGILPPFIQDGHCLMDGGMLDNLPIEPMYHFCHGGKVIGSKIVLAPFRKEGFEDMTGVLSNQKIFFEKFLSYGAPKKSPPLIGEIIYRGCLAANDFLHEERLLKGLHEVEIDIVIEDSSLSLEKDFDRIVALGYTAAMKKLRNYSLS